MPKAGIVLTVEHAEVRTEPGLVAGRPWDPAHRAPAGSIPTAACIWADHIKANDDTSLLARVARRGISERLMGVGTSLDYRHNLY